MIWMMWGQNKPRPGEEIDRVEKEIVEEHMERMAERIGEMLQAEVDVMARRQARRDEEVEISRDD